MIQIWKQCNLSNDLCLYILNQMPLPRTSSDSYVKPFYSIPNSLVLILYQVTIYTLRMVTDTARMSVGCTALAKYCIDAYFQFSMKFYVFKRS